MSILIALFLGIIQGITEFLPISSSGHLILFENVLGVSGSNVFFNLILHFASLIAVVIIFWKDVVYLVKNPFGKEMKRIIVASIPTIIVAFVVRYCVEDYILVMFLGYGFLLSSFIIFITSILQKRKTNLGNLDFGYKQSFIIGLVQGFAVLPGISRSGSTICAGLIQGINREESAKFSFLISIPIILGGVGLEIVEGVRFGFGHINIGASIIGFFASFLVALFTIKLMMKIVKRGNWIYFSIYLLLLSIFVLINQYVLCLF